MSHLRAAGGHRIETTTRERFEGIRYASVKLKDGVTFLVLLEVEDGVEYPLPGLPETQEFYDRLPGWYAEPPEVGPGTLVGSYRLFSDPVTAG